MQEDWTQSSDPTALFKAWLEDARALEPNDPEAMSLATVDAAGLPDVRMVLLKGADEGGIVFYTNSQSDKGRELAENPRAAALFHWKSLRRQVRFRGPISPASAAESDAYFASRARQSQLGALASQQSRPLESRAVLEQAVEALDRRYAGQSVPRPPHWHGYRLAPTQIEFWRDGAFRLHDRIRFFRQAPSAPWSRERLYP
jgi:pyridoxamine 5'-phosphate oxidase